MVMVNVPTPGLQSYAIGATINCANNAFNFADGNGLGASILDGCNCPGDSYTGSVSGFAGGSVANSANGNYAFGGADNPGYNYTDL